MDAKFGFSAQKTCEIGVCDIKVKLEPPSNDEHQIRTRIILVTYAIALDSHCDIMSAIKYQVNVYNDHKKYDRE